MMTKTTKNKVTKLSGCYVLKNKIPVKAKKIQQWMIFFNNSKNRVVAVTKIPEYDVIISTVFIGIGTELFESKIFGGKHDGTTLKYNTWKQAKKGHAFLVRRI